jgi:hypothetical protein
MPRVYAVLLAVVFCATAWPNGDGIAREEALMRQGRKRNMRPIIVDRLAVLHEDLSVDVLRLPTGQWDDYNEVGSVQAWDPAHGLARVRAEYLLRNRMAKRTSLTIRFPISQFYGVREREGDGWPQRTLLPGQGPAVKLGRKTLTTVYSPYWLLGADEAETLRDADDCAVWGCDGLFLDPVTRALRKASGLARLPGAFGFLGFRISLGPKQKTRLAVQYLQRFYYNPDRRNAWQLTYIMRNSVHWKHWGTTSITVRMPRSRCDHIAFSPGATSHRTTAREHIYTINMGRPSANLHLAVDVRRPGHR